MNVQTLEPALLHDVRATLGEGPVWVAAQQALYWLDIKGRKIFRRDAAGALTTWPTPFRVGSIAPFPTGGFIAGCENGFAFVDPEAGRYDILVDPEPERVTNRFNDGKVDRAGRFWAGTMDDTERAAAGALYLFEGGRPTRVDDGYRVTNGPAFSVDGTRMYHTDSALQTIYAFDLDPAGEPTNKRPFARFAGADGYPDGMTVDTEDCLWVAFWDGWCIRRLSPEGETIAVIPMPVERPTSVAFGGPDLRELYVTSARIGFDDEALTKQPHAGGLFVLSPGVRGVAELPYQGTLIG